MDVEEIIRRADEDLVTAEAQLRAARDRVEEAQRRVDELHELRRGFALAIERYGDAAPPAGAEVSAPAESPGGEPALRSWQELSLAEACLAALAEFGRPATTSEIHSKLAEAGRSVKSEQLRSSLGYLERRAKRIKRAGRALWDLQS